MPEGRGILRRYGHAQLLGALVLLLVAQPFAESFVSALVVDVFLLLTVVSVVVACAAKRHHLIVGVCLAVLMLISQLHRALYDVQIIGVVDAMLSIALFGYVAALVLADVFRHEERVSTDTICGALAAYLLLGVIWTFVYMLLESFEPGSFSGLGYAKGTSGVTDYRRFLGYSFVTLTTLGYGNVVPTSVRADALAVLEAVIGQIYLTVLVARLVALNLRDRG